MGTSYRCPLGEIYLNIMGLGTQFIHGLDAGQSKVSGVRFLTVSLKFMTIKAHQHAAGAKGGNNFKPQVDLGESSLLKIHVLTNTQGLPLKLDLKVTIRSLKSHFMVVK